MTHIELTQKITEAIGLAEAPVAVYYSETKPEGAYEWNCKGPHFCPIGRLRGVREGTPLVVDGQNPGCGGAAHYMGWVKDFRDGFEYFLAHDDEGKGERFKKTPELAIESLKTTPFVPANGRYCIFHKLADLPEEIEPEVVIIFGDADDISGLVFLTNYGRPDNMGVIAPLSAGCGSIVSEPRAQAKEPHPKAVLGMFDPAARASMEKGLLSFSTPYPMFKELVENIPGSFLEINPWLRLRDRQ